MSTDPRFARLKTDPRFRRPKQKNLKVEIDERFRDVLESEEFGGKGKGKGKSAAGARVDKRGRAITSSHHADQLKRFYRLRSPDAAGAVAAEGGDEGEAGFVDYARGEGNLSSSGDEDDDEEEEDSEVEEDELEVGGKKRNRLHEIESDSEESDSDSDHLHVDLSESEDDENINGKSAFPDEADEAEEEEEEESVPATKRIAAVNLDWDNLRAEDLYAVFNSFLQTSANKSKITLAEGSSSALGKLVNVKIYPSEFGKERMEREEKEGPGGGIFLSREKDLERRRREKGKGKKREQIQIAEEESEEEESEDEEEEDDEDDFSDGEDFDDDEEEEEDEDESDEEDGMPKQSRDLPGRQEIDGLEIMSDVESDAGSEDIDMDQLRQYQLERLRYFYAIATFSTVAAAEYVMNECNGTEFERTANILDLSYVPEGMEFAEDDVKDEATKEPKGYKGNDFVTDALRHSKVKLTWDQDDPNRVKVTRRALTREEIEEQDFKNLVASSGSEESEPDFDDDNDLDDVASSSKTTKTNKKQLVKERTEKLRNLLLANDEEDGGDVWGKAGTAWADELEDIRAGGGGGGAKDKATTTKGKGKGKKGGDGDDLEITFRPGLSVNKAGEERDEENMTTLEKYQLRMKEKKQRKKEKIELKKAEKDLGAEGGVDGEKEKAKGGKDEFFGSDSDEEEEDEVVSKTKSKSKTVASAASTKEKKSTDLVPHLAPQPTTEADLLALVGNPSDKPDTNFSMKDILKSEKETAKKRRRRRGGKKDMDGADEKELGPDGWKIDVKDERFKALHEEPEFAIDPSNPHFVKTKAMSDLLAERTRIRTSKNKENKPEPELRKSASGVSNPDNSGTKEKDLDALVKSVKRRMESAPQKAKRKRSRK
ncbi:hypothetical protein CI109_101875 [Kwoniella shandongensis]|uniref:Uncharacterized protein n=1 Tax=Kwoniella shandongensis TaxID=1734106 RepID=A0A5M6BRA9_9TREE|nr:uncharacterized protein CI109_007047 [Kwoniella shandongensis]KAA5524612.1 hypothetical protein CI109_007047 [Kwoniella shandongensis]